MHWQRNRADLFDAAALAQARADRKLGPYAARPGTRTADPSVPRCERCDKPRELAEGTPWCEHCLAIVRRAEARAERSKTQKQVVRRSTVGHVKRRCIVCAGAMRCAPENTSPVHKWCRKFLSNVQGEAAA